MTVLCIGFGGFIQGDKKLMQRMMRFRVIAQGLTILSMGAGMSYLAAKEQKAAGS